LPGTFCSSIAHQSRCDSVSVCVGGTQLDSVSTVWADAAVEAATTAHASALRTKGLKRLIGRSPVKLLGLGQGLSLPA
jgi:hypothetical protein